ncbi:MAG: cytochrome c oxidase subunit 3 [Gemmatimonadetes bacterium]|nr:cytochrome c oxidase subunit 3 [Gemmatimonadota bacterium]MCY3943108.1 cytochrome c oxidase subunit 3 [Gemmatimonadota bacterium]
MTANTTVLPFRPRPRRSEKVISNGVLGMILFVFVEIMLFAGFISAFVIIRARAVGSVWPPPHQPRLPFEQTAVNTSALLASGILLLAAHRMHLKERSSRAVGALLALATLLGSAFVFLQGVEWVALIGEGLTMTSSTYGSLFYTIIGAHAAHAVVAIGVLAWAWLRVARSSLSREAISSVAIFWYFVVLVWPFLYFQVYL